MAMFRPWVQLWVSTTFSGSIRNSSPAASLQEKSTSAPSRAAGWLPRPGLAHSAMASPTARRTASGLGKDVAPWSR